jgi:hypothetical protein
MQFVVSLYSSRAIAMPAMRAYEDIETYGTVLVGVSPGKLKTGEPVLPILAANPVIVREISVSRRQSIDASVSIDIYHTGLEIIDKARDDYLRVRIYAAKYDGTDITLLDPVFDGSVVNIASSRGRGIITIDASEYDDRIGSMFPPELITRADFPDAPDLVAGTLSRQIVIGPFQYPIPARQVDRDGRVFYICDPPLSIPPAIVYADGRIVPSDSYNFFAGRMQNSGLEYTGLLFSRPVSEVVGKPVQYVTVSHGHGMRASNAIEALARISGIGVTRRLTALAKEMEGDFPMSILLNKRDNAFSILTKRILPQTPYITRMYLGLVDIVDANFNNSPVAEIQPGNGWISGQIGVSRAGFGDVVNNLQVNVGMTHHGGPALRRPLMQIVRNATNGPYNLRSIASRSQSIYGPRALTIDAGDLLVYWGPNGQPMSPSGERLANYIIQHSAFEGVRYTYACSDDAFTVLSLGDVVELTDPLVAESTVRAMVVRQEFSSAPTITFEHILS